MNPADLPALRRTLTPQVVYVDLDGTLLGPGGSLFASTDGGVSLRAAEAVARLHRGAVELVPMSGRTPSQVHEVARLLGASAFIAELGGVTRYGDEVVRHFGAYRGEGTPYEAMARTGAVALLLEAFPRRLEPHAPWAFLARESSMLLRGEVDLREARRVLSEAGFDWLDVLDNGVIPRSFETLDTREVHAYHVLPRGVTKASAAAADMARRGLSPKDCIAIGDSPSDALLASAVGAAFIVANGRADVERSGVAADNLYATSGSHGDGFAEVVEGLWQDRG